MIEFTKQWVINIVALVLFIVMFEMLLPTGKMKKYINLVTSTILIIAIISPLTGFFGRNADLAALQVSTSNDLDKLEVEKESKIFEKEQMKQIVDVYRDKIIEQLEQNAEEVDGVKQAYADVIFNEDYNSKNFGEIKRAYIEIIPESNSANNEGDSSTTNNGDSSTINKGDSSTTNEGDSSSKAAIEDGSAEEAISVGSAERVGSIKPVGRIKTVNVGEEASTSKMIENCDPSIKKKLEDRISGVFGISSDNIVISQINNSQK